MIHNFIHLNQKYEDVFYIIDENRPEDADEEDEVEAVPEVNANALNQWRNGIAREMWDSYVIYNQNNNYLNSSSH